MKRILLDLFCFALFSIIAFSCKKESSSVVLSTWRQTSITTPVDAIVINGSDIFAGGYGVNLSTNNGDSWISDTTGLKGNYLTNTLAVSGSNILVATTTGVFLSTNNGSSWVAADSGLSYSATNSFTSFATSGNNIFAGTEGVGVYMSSNNGISWAPVNTGLQGSLINALAINGENIFAATPDGVYLSVNNGGSWAPTALANTFVNSLAITEGNVFAGSPDIGVLLSTNNGSTWNLMNSGLPDSNNIFGQPSVNVIAINDKTIFAGTDGQGLYLSTNNGNSWIADTTGLGLNNEVFSISFDNTYAYIGTNFGLYKQLLPKL